MGKTYSTFEAMEELSRQRNGQIFQTQCKSYDMALNNEVIRGNYDHHSVVFRDSAFKSKWYTPDLTLLTNSFWSEMKWTLKPVIVNWETARKHMEEGGRCRYSAWEGEGDFSIREGFLCLEHIKHNCFYIDMLDDEWELIPINKQIIWVEDEQTQ